MLCFVFAALIVALDQFFKHWIVRTLEVREVGPTIIPGILGLTRWENDGAMLNILAGQQWLLAGIAFVAAIVLVMILLRYNEGFWGTLGLAAVLGGTCGNLFDRIFNDGYVVDMFRTLFINFPIFNIADIFITLGFATFCVHFIILSIKAGRENNPVAETGYNEQPDEDYIYPDETGEPNYGEMPDTDTAVYPQSVSEPAVSTEQYTAKTAGPVSYEPPQQYEPVQQYDPLQQYEPATEVTPDISFTMESLNALEAELDSIEDYNVDDLLREYGLEDDK